MSSATLVATNGSTPSIPMDAWLQTSARKFFSSFNWDDNPPEIHEVKQKAVENPSTDSLGLDLSVGQFFATVNWDDKAVMPQTQTPDNLLAQLLEDPAKDFTLDEFSDLF